MKKFYSIAILAALAIVGCSKVEPATIDSSKDQVAISFMAVNHISQTKVDGTAYPDTAKFGSYALFTGGYDFDASKLSSYTTYINDAEITYHNQSWSASDNYYWPKSGKLTFLSYSPKSAGLVLGTTADDLLKVENYTTGDYSTQITKYDWVNDLMVAAVDSNLTQTTTPVATVFNHALAKLHFEASASALDYGGVTYHIVINSIAIKGANTIGDLAWSSKSVASWSNQDTPGESVLYTNTESRLDTCTNVPGELTLAYARKMNDPADPKDSKKTVSRDFYVIPQTLPAVVKDNGNITSGAYVEVKYTIYSCNNGTIMSTDEITNYQELRSIKYNTKAIDTWEPNYSYAYNIVISPYDQSNPILWAPSVKAWDTTTSPAYNIQ